MGDRRRLEEEGAALDSEGPDLEPRAVRPDDPDRESDGGGGEEQDQAGGQSRGTL